MSNSFTDHPPLDISGLMALLNHVHPDSPRDEWVEVLMAAKSEFGDNAKEVMREWSATAPSFKPGAFNATWKSIRPSGGITIKTLVKKAMDNGYKFAPLSREEEKRLKAERKRLADLRANADRLEAEKRQANYNQAKEKAQAIWEKLTVCSPNRANSLAGTHLHPYYAKKQMIEEAKRFGVAPISGNALVIPVYKFNQQGKKEIVSLQFIDPEGGKRFLKGGEMKGGFVALPGSWGYVLELVICEGYATGLTLAAHYAPLSNIVCAFNANNLKPVADAWKRQYPRARMLIAADNDRETEQRTGKNIGLEKATAAALAVGGAVFIPEFAEHEQGTDWNDRYILDLSKQNNDEVTEWR
ncbi:PriCT-2 domain-containing protein [Thiomicrospira microaerophila]|uniref:PriCT-2 domain-containing protein n=1 Tax=Thiomicrospira microaerophila TaxID=406020 RepID=UPI00200E8748|nr:PriCT-2 domain-containing protein [Thiomicrospira microaerophila]UQB42758.1 PriCT-2 domain-containing protein [Thiomicrospira microaerophila]